MTRPVSLISGVLAIFSLPLLFTYRILPVNGTPYVLFGFILLLNAINIYVSSVYDFTQKKDRRYLYTSAVLMALIVLFSLGGVIFTSIADRQRTAPVYGVHDIILQQEAAMRYLVQHKNPYGETYFGTPVESFHYDENGKPAVNPALYHFVMPPWYIIFPFAVYLPANRIFGFFDGRMVTVVLLVALVPILMSWYKNRFLALLTFFILSMSPLWVDYLIEGRSDFFALFWFFVSLYFLERKRLFLASVIFGLAVCSKQTVWFAIPCWAASIFVQSKMSVRTTAYHLLVSALTVAALVAPFLIWNAKAFLDSTVLYLSSGGPTGYPVSGYGLGMIFVSYGVIRDIHAYYPFVIWQIIFGFPVIVVSVKKLFQRFTSSGMILAFSAFLAVIWYASRYFNNSHAITLGILTFVGILKRIDEDGGANHAS